MVVDRRERFGRRRERSRKRDEGGGEEVIKEERSEGGQRLVLQLRSSAGNSQSMGVILKSKKQLNWVGVRSKQAEDK